MTGRLRRWFRTVFRLHLKLVVLTAQDGEEKPSSRDGAAASVVQDTAWVFNSGQDCFACAAQDSEKKLSLHYGAPQDWAVSLLCA